MHIEERETGDHNRLKQCIRCECDAILRETKMGAAGFEPATKGL